MWWPDAEAKAAIAGKISPALESNLPPGISVHGPQFVRAIGRVATRQNQGFFQTSLRFT